MKKCFKKVESIALRVKMALDSKKAEGFVDSGVKILIAVVIGAVLLAGLYALFAHTFIPVVDVKISEMFNYTE
jgi:hypothetical protein